MKKITLIVCIVALGFAACQNNPNTDSTAAVDTLVDTATAVDMHTSQISLDWAGTYEGTLPCADCPGIKTTIELKDDNTFSKHVEYLDTKASKFNEAGKIEWQQDGNSIALISEDGDKQLYKVREGSLVMLDQEGKEIDSELAEHYVLNKLN